ncbi:MAG: nicotinate (nicotinamide) nucleotide adenylyltransferase [Deltaproteobacteria bacterium]|nr:nicotinate (nicotinamide) nucleotide adenylyltransferase [Deltaproteobacteria bacterium]MBW1961215.1 nicotinate (nicotinamide) nucleotide adenylyltransferase [Deltaproteobacteria bacterium]MBW2151706.1 nicotinate (nicotinamide) nucleotide adenylyltransferase [Deltaproteobacteria bacterium]
MRIGLFGGTFNPIHFGHLRTTLEVKEAFSLNRIYLIPSAIPPHKAPNGVANAKDRFEMIRLAISNHSDFVVSEVELDRAGPSYSIDTVNHFQATLPGNTDLFLILGLDAFLEIDTWKAYREFFERVPFIVMDRPAKRASVAIGVRNLVYDFLKTKISSGYVYCDSKNRYSHKTKKPVFLAHVTQMDISSTKIRRCLKQGRSIEFLVPQSVSRYIETKGLYR